MPDKEKDLIEEIKTRILAKRAARPFNSGEMRQVPLSFFVNEHDEDRYGDIDSDKVAFAKKYFDRTCGYLHLGWDIDAYWSMVGKKVMIPAVSAIHTELVRLGHNEDNKLMWGDADGYKFFIPVEDPTIKVLVHTTQCRDYLYILGESPPRYGKAPHPSLHIRRIWRRWDSKRNWRKDDKDRLIGPRGSIYKILENLSTLEEYADDHYEYSRRHSLEYYRKIRFDMEPRNYKFNGIYGDFRDGGYIFSLSDFKRPENSARQFNELELIATCYLPGLISELNLKTDIPWIDVDKG